MKSAGLVALACGALVTWTAPAPAVSQSDDLAGAITDSRARLDLVRAERTRLEAEAVGIGESLRDAAAALANLERRISASAAVVVELRLQADAAAQSAFEKRRELAHVRDGLAARRAAVHRRARDIYKAGPLRSVRALFGASSPTDLIARYRYLRRMADADQSLLLRVQELERRLATESALLDESLTQASRLRLEGLQEAARLGAEEAEREAVVAAFRDREGMARDRLARLTADEERMAALVADLETRHRARGAAARLAASRAESAAEVTPPDRVAAPATEGSVEATEDTSPVDAPDRLREGEPVDSVAAPPVTAPTVSRANVGTLPWPVEGDIVYRFGRERRSDGTVLRWAGLGIAAPPGTPVTAVAAGAVELAGRFEGYGNTVVLGHGNGIYTLYLYLDDVNVVQGRSVETGEGLGTVGGSNTPEGPHLEFQVRVAPADGPPRAEDPLTWLLNRR